MTVTVQALGWWAGRMFQPLIEEINFVVFWYRTQPQVSVIEEPGPEGGGIGREPSAIRADRLYS